MKRVGLTTHAPLANDRVAEFDGEREYLATGSVYDDGRFEPEMVTYESRPSRADLAVQPGDVCFARMHATKKVFEISPEKASAILSTGFAVLRPDPNIVDSAYLRRWVASDAFQLAKNRLCTGATQKAITNAKIKVLPLPLPLIFEQKRIAKILDAADMLRAQRRESLAQLDALVQSSFLEMFGDPLTNWKGWEETRLEAITYKITDGKHGDCRPDEGSRYFFVSVKDIKDGEIDYANARQIAREDFEEVHRRTQLEPLDVLITNSGTIGRTAVIRDSPNVSRTTFQKSVAIVKPKREIVDSVFLRSTLDFNVDHLSRTSSGSSQKNLLLGQLRNFQIPLPPLYLQRRFAAAVESIERKKVLMRAHLAELDALFASLQSRAFNAEL